jgi:hypothetical protein
MTDPSNRDSEIDVGPYVPCLGGITYQVTLETGAIATSPIAFPQDRNPTIATAVVTADGKVFSVPAPAEVTESVTEFERLMRQVLNSELT